MPTFSEVFSLCFEGGPDAHGDDGLWNVDALECEVQRVARSERVAGRAVDAERGADVA